MEQSDDVGEGTRAAKFYEREGFTRVGVMKGVGRKYDRWLDAGIFQMSLREREQDLQYSIERFPKDGDMLSWA